MKKVSKTRREFLKTAAAGAAGLAVINPRQLLAKTAADFDNPRNKWPGRVVINFNKEADDFLKPNETVIKKMVDDNVKVLTGETSLGAAWKAVFPDTLELSSKIAIKTNFLNAGLSAPHPSSVEAIVKGLIQMDFNGTSFPAENITIYDMNNRRSFDNWGLKQDSVPGVNLVHHNYNGQKFGDGALNDRPYAPSLNACNFLINVFSPRGHGINNVGSITLGFKSHYGTYSNPSGMHGGDAMEYLRDMTCTGPVFEKLVLSICSGIYGQRIGNGPGGSPESYENYAKSVDPTVGKDVSPTTVIMGTDAVSVEAQTIKMMRINEDKSYTTDSMPDYLKASAGMAAMNPNYNIGIIDESNMDVRRIINEDGLVPLTPAAELWNANRITVSRLSRNSVFIEYSLQNDYTGRKAIVEIRNIKGTIIRRLSKKVLGHLNQFSWDGKDLAGNPAPKGIYAVHVTVGRTRLGSRVTLV